MRTSMIKQFLTVACILVALVTTGGLVLLSPPLGAHPDLVLQIEEYSEQISENHQDTEFVNKTR